MEKTLRGYLSAVGLVLVVWFSFVPAAAWAIDSGTLIDKSDLFDGRMVTYRGEVVGDVMVRSDGIWLNINDDPYSRQGERFHLAGYNRGQSVLAPKTAAKTVKYAGNYVQRGDTVEVTGIFHKAASKYGGEMMIEAKSVTLVKRGFPLVHIISRRRAVLAVVWMAIAVGLFGLLRMDRLKRRVGSA